MIILSGALIVSVLLWLLFFFSIFTIILAVILPVLLFIIPAVCWYRIFAKMGLPAWQALIPGYNAFTLWQATGKPQVKLPAVVMIISIVLVLLLGILAILAPKSEYNKDYIQLFTFMTILGMAGIAAYLAWGVEVYTNLALSFGKGIKFANGILFLPVLYLPRLAFGPAKYAPLKNI